MAIYMHERNIHFHQSFGHTGGAIIDEKLGAVKGFSMGISYYDHTEYNQPGLHNDQEGFYVLEGEGKAKIGDEEFAIYPGMAFIAQKETPHSIKTDDANKPVKVLWVHGAVD